MGGYEFDQIICPVDGGEQGFAAHGYVRSQDVTTRGAAADTYCSRLAVARCKVSNLSVPDNEQASMLLGTRVVEHMLNVVPEAPKRDIGVNFLCDSQCTSLALNPSLSQKERRRHNVCIRISRNLANISAINGETLINLYWLPGSRNPADLSSKTHHNLASVVNGSFYRHGHSSYSDTFPCKQSILFATMKAGTCKFRGLSSLVNHTSQCHYCCSKFGREVAGVLVFHTELLGPGNSTTSTTGTQLGTMIFWQLPTHC